MSDDGDRDPRLSAALRHAPDQDQRPPPALDAAIAAAARAALRPTPVAPHVWVRLRAWLAALGTPPPAWAGGAAAVVVAALTLRLWVDEPLPPPVVAESAPAAKDVQAPAPATAATQAPPAPPRTADNGPPQPALMKKAKVAEATATPPPPSPAAPAQRSEESADKRRADAPSANADAAQAATAAPAPTPPAAFPAAPPPAPAVVGRLASSTPSVALQEARRSMAPAPAAKAMADAAAATPPLWRALIDAAIAEAGSPSQREAWVQLDAATRAQWRPVGRSDGIAEAAPALVERVLVGADGQPPQRATLRIERDGVRWVEPRGSWFAPLSPAAVQALLARF